MLVTRSGKLQISVFLVSILFSLSNCKKEPRLFRFIDNLKEENVTSSPLISLEQRFETIEQNWSGTQMFPLEYQMTRYQCIPTRAQILAWDMSERPEGMKILINGREIEFAETPIEEKPSWRWKRIEETIEPVMYKGFPTEAGTIIMSKNDVFASQDFFLPEGLATIEITAKSGHQMKYLPRIAVYLNETKVGEVLVKQYRKYILLTENSSGMHRVRFDFSGLTKLVSYKEEEKLYIDAIEIKSDKDLLLIHQPNLDTQSILKDEYKAIYRILPTKKIIVPGPFSHSRKGRSSADLILETGNSLAGDVDLTGGENIIEVICYSKPKGVALSLQLDGEKIARQWVTPWEGNSYLFRVSTPGGKHRLKIDVKKPNNVQNYPACQLFLQNVSVMPGKPSDYAEIYRIREDFHSDDLDVGGNPYSIKKKLRLNNFSIDALFAPPRSSYDFVTTISNNGNLEFGYGLFETPRTAGNSTPKGARFSILIEADGKTGTLFSKIIDPRKQNNAYSLYTDKVNLGGYNGKTVRIRFLTEHLDPTGKKENPNAGQIGGLAFWYNPTLVEKKGLSPRKEKRDFSVILISIDTLRADHLGCYGYQKDTSPAIDELTHDAVLFLDTYAPSPSTLPSHMSMLTALYPVHHGFSSQRIGIIPALNPSIATLSERLRACDYFTGAFTGGGYVSEKYGFSRGFDFYHEDNGSTLRNDSAQQLFDSAWDWISKNKDKKFFLFLHTYQVHAPYYCPDPYNLMFLNKNAKDKEGHAGEISGLSRYRRLAEEERQTIISLYDGEIRYTDDVFIKPLLEELKKSGIYDDTMIILTSDHGEEFYEHQGWFHEHTLYNELLKVPLIIKLPDSQCKGKKITGIVNIIDIMPTILEETGIRYSEKDLDGRSLLGLVHKNKKSNRTAHGFQFVYTINPDLSYETKLIKISTVHDKFKLITNHEYPQEDLSSGFKVSGGPPFQVDEIELFDLEMDPSESRNIAKKNGAKVLELSKRRKSYYQKAKEIAKAKKRAQESEDQELRKRLKALGYIR